MTAAPRRTAHDRPRGHRHRKQPRGRARQSLRRRQRHQERDHQVGDAPQRTLGAPPGGLHGPGDRRQHLAGRAREPVRPVGHARRSLGRLRRRPCAPRKTAAGHRRFAACPGGRHPLAVLRAGNGRRLARVPARGHPRRGRCHRAGPHPGRAAPGRHRAPHPLPPPGRPRPPGAAQCPAPDAGHRRSRPGRAHLPPRHQRHRLAAHLGRCRPDQDRPPR